MRRVLVPLCLILASLSLARMVALYRPSDPNRVYYGTDTRAFVLLLGAALGALTAGAPVARQRWIRRALIALGTVGAVGLALAMAMIEISSSWLYRGGYGAIAIVMAVTLLGGVQPGTNPLRRLFETRPLVALGLISYGVYLWHWPATVWLNEKSTGVSGVALFALRSAATVAVALVSYVVVEQPIRHRRIRLNRVLPGLVPAVIVTVVAIVLLVPALAFPSVTTAPVSARVAGSRGLAAAYQSAPRCDASTPALQRPPGRPLRVQLVGSSFAHEVAPCLGRILKGHGVALETVARDGATLCSLLPQVREQLTDPSTRPDVGILFAPLLCTGGGPDPLRTLLTLWESIGAHPYYAPQVPSPAVTGPKPFDRRNAGVVGGVRVQLLDGGVFLRDAGGSYLWRMPCLTGEVGCAPDGTLAVRFPGDGFHFCANPAWKGGPCDPANAAGERRAAAALAGQLLSSLHGVQATPPP